MFLVKEYYEVVDVEQALDSLKKDPQVSHLYDER